jgi:thiosulfate dehydrogenase
MGKFIAGMIFGVILLAVGVFCLLFTGMVPVATSAPPLPMEKQLAKLGLNARIAKEAPKTEPFQAGGDDYLAGAELYRADCAVCHGLPKQEQTRVAKGMYPHPPQLFAGNGVTDDPAGETYWKVSNGIRLTGMPGFHATLSEKQVWQVAFLLANADKLPDAAKAELARPLPVDAAPAPAIPPPAAVAPPPQTK